VSGAPLAYKTANVWTRVSILTFRDQNLLFELRPKYPRFKSNLFMGLQDSLPGVKSVSARQRAGSARRAPTHCGGFGAPNKQSPFEDAALLRKR
jgi:hypothetical protein